LLLLIQGWLDQGLPRLDQTSCEVCLVEYNLPVLLASLNCIDRLYAMAVDASGKFFSIVPYESSVTPIHEKVQIRVDEAYDRQCQQE
jgi:hypothetical protein